jgi:hypothetical protein
MGTLESKFSRHDIETLIESMSDWETLGNEEFHILNMVKSAPMPPEDHEAYEMMRSIKDHFSKREMEIKENRGMRQERATLLKAKLMLVRSDMGIDQLFEMATESATKEKSEVNSQKEVKPCAGSDKTALELAEYFIRDMGVWKFYEKFLAEQKSG